MAGAALRSALSFRTAQKVDSPSAWTAWTTLGSTLSSGVADEPVPATDEAATNAAASASRRRDPPSAAARRPLLSHLPAPLRAAVLSRPEPVVPVAIDFAPFLRQGDFRR